MCALVGAGFSLVIGAVVGVVFSLYYESIKRIEISQIEALCKALDCKIEDIFEYIPEE